MSTNVVMPQMGESIAEGTITKWYKKIGEHIERDETLFEISTDKVDAEIPSPASGTLTEIKVKEGETVAVNTIVAVIGNAMGAATSPGPPQPVEEKREAAAAPQSRAAQADGDSRPANTTAATQAPKEAKETKAPPAQAKADAPASREDLRKSKSSPLVRKIAEEHGIDISRLEGTGTSGRVTKNDILSFIESGAGKSSQPSVSSRQPQEPVVHTSVPVHINEGDRVEQMSAMRKKIAEHMIISRRTSAHVTSVYEVDFTKVEKLRSEHKQSFFERTGVKLTYMPFIFQAVINSILRFPVFNSQVNGDQIVYKRDINLGMAVAIDSGLIVPVIKRAEDLSLAGLARSAHDLAERARSKQLKPDEVSGGTFTITNPGVFGGLFGTPIINQPQVAILGVGVVEKRPKVISSPEGEDFIAIRSMAYLALSFDHRIIDGADAEKFLSHTKQFIETAGYEI